jgi:SAM-dependent methyltransferase
MSDQNTLLPFSSSNKYYDIIYRDKNYRKETEYVSNIIRRYKPDARQLLELGSGTGNYSVFFSELGYEITGIDISAEMVAISNSKSIMSFTALRDDMSLFELNKQFDAAVSLFHVINYLLDDKKIISCFKQVAKHLKPNGIFVFDVWHSDAVIKEKLKRTIKSIENDSLQITRTAEAIDFYDNVVNVHHGWKVCDKSNNELEEFNELHSMRHFNIEEINSFADAANFTVIKAEEFLTAKNPSADTWGVCYILQKND